MPSAEGVAQLLALNDSTEKVFMHWINCATVSVAGFVDGTRGSEISQCSGS
jgi:hypothetical protein